MAKQSYKIPYSLNTNYLDAELSIQNKEGIGLRPVSVRTILFYLGAFFVYLIIILKTFMVDASLGTKALFTVSWFFLSIFWIKEDSSKRNGISLVPSLANYIPKMARHVKTRTGNRMYDFVQISGLAEDAFDERGTIHYLDGTYGHGFRVVGSASILLFDQDREMILNSVAKFYNKLDTDVEIIFDTTKESQKVTRQVAYVEDQFAERELKNIQGLNKLFVQKRDVLQDYVGKRFASLHQYLFVKAKNIETLEKFIQMLQQEVSSSSSVFKKLQLMGPEDLTEYFKKVKGIE